MADEQKSEQQVIELPKLHKDADSRLVGYFGHKSDPSGNFERVFCYLCGGPAGWVSRESSKYVAPAHVVVTCNECDEKIIRKMMAQGGQFPLQQVPDEIAEGFGFRQDLPASAPPPLK